MAVSDEAIPLLTGDCFGISMLSHLNPRNDIKEIQWLNLQTLPRV